MSHPARSNPGPAKDSTDALARLRGDSGRVTRSRRDLVDLFFSADQPYTAAEIAERLPLHDVATVYRALNHLEALGVIEHVHLGHGPATYRRTGLATTPAVCDGCGAVIEIPLAEFEAVTARLSSTYGFVVDPHHFALTGRCRRCAAG